ncbi:tRNA (N(6)-L-threonylcarbamoyladenosine(37)-C(2))-methylthiotransferase MtaB [Peptococcaceae bacterium]|nr:tRNA (N(6)-L-threonylcarbamoyladenosine(37)-C(2))-methylthiotransferase MtaB [Peptococcaceae bacterium]
MKSVKKAAVYTLGCKLNQAESAAIADGLKKIGYEIVDFNDLADVYVINTCTVTHTSDSKSRQAIRRAVKKNPSALVVITGCYAQMKPDELAKIDGVNLVVSNFEKQNIPKLLNNEEFIKRISSAVEIIHKSEPDSFVEMPVTDYDRTRAFIKIQEGCNNYCSYCIIPYARGKPRSCKPERVISEIKKLILSGYSEIVLTGIHIGAYGLDLKNRIDLTKLVSEIVSLPGCFRIRLSSIEPKDITLKLIDIIESSGKICKHLHIPLQSGDDSILKAMRRDYDTAYYAELINYIRSRMSDIAITTDVMVGFPGEDEDAFKNTYNFCKKINFAAMHVFKYSVRHSTIAANFPNQVSSKEKEHRSRKLIALSQDMAKSYAAGFRGKTLEVLVERFLESEGCAEGISDNYLRVVFSDQEGKEIDKGSLVDVKISDVRSDGKLLGRVAKHNQWLQ